MKKILVTGCAGFIGFHLSKNFLQKKYKIIGIDSLNSYYSKNLKTDRLKILKNYKNFSFYKININNKKKIDQLFKKKNIHYIYHLAAQAGVRYSLKNPDTYIKNNIMGFYNFLETIKKYKIKHLLYASSSSVYGANKKFPWAEEMCLNSPLQLYASTKISNEAMAQAYSNLYNIPSTGLRFFTVYGPWGRPDMSLFKFTKNILSNKSIDIYNNGNHVRDFTYIDDIVTGLVDLLKKAPARKFNFSQILNIGNSKPVKLMDFIECLEKNLNLKAKKNFLKIQTGDIYKTHSSVRKINKLTKYRAKINYQVGIKKFVKWYKNYHKIR